MKNASAINDLANWLCTTTVVALALGGPATLSAQQPVLSAAATRIAMHRVGSAQLEAPAPEPPQPGQNNTPPLKDDLFAGTEKFAKGATEATEVNMDPESLSMVGGPDAVRAHHTLLNVVHHYEYDKPGMYNIAEVDEFRHKLDGPDWHCSVHSRDLKSGESTDICSRRRAPDMVEQAIITVEPKELTFIHQIRRANGQGGSLGSDGLESLGMIPGLPLGVSMALLQPGFEADRIASAALLRGQVAHFDPNFRIDLPRNFRPYQADMKNFKWDFTPEQKRQLEQLQKDFKTLPPTPPTP